MVFLYSISFSGLLVFLWGNDIFSYHRGNQCIRKQPSYNNNNNNNNNNNALFTPTAKRHINMASDKNYSKLRNTYA